MNINKYTKKELFELLKNERNAIGKIKEELKYFKRYSRDLELKITEQSEDIDVQKKTIEILISESAKRGRAIIYLGKMLADDNNEKLFLELKQAAGQKEES